MPDTPVKPFGLTQIYAPPRGTDPTVDIVFVHGLNGNPKDSWTSKNGCYWPADLLPEFLGAARILTYGYNANVTAFTDGASRDSILSHAETLASTLAANRNLRSCSDRPIIFVCHSLGGLVVKQALIYSRSLSNEKTEHLRSVYVSTFGILFLGTPHNGSDVAKWGTLLHNICTAVLPKKFMDSSPHLIKSLQTNNETLRGINSGFAPIQPRLHIYLFHETRTMDLHGTRSIIVDETSAAPYIDGVERMGIEADHSHMCKFEDETSPGYEVVVEAIQRYSREARSVISKRWVEEYNTRQLNKKQKAEEIYDDRIDHMSESVPNPSTGQSLTWIPPPPASEGRSSPVPDINDSLDDLSSSQWKDIPVLIAPPGFHPNATFFGMQKEMDALHTRLYRAKDRNNRTMAVLISGGPGSGKTHLARQYVFTHRECYSGGIFWIDAKSRESAYKCFWEIAQRANLIGRREAQDPKYQESRTYVTEVRDWLEKRDQWLMIYDGITFDHEDDINGFRLLLPWNKRCSIIYTSRDATLRRKSRLFEPYCISISRLSVQDACKLLFKDLGIKRPTHEQTLRATEIVEYYECLPLALHAVGHRLNATSKPIEKFKVRHHPTDKKLAEPFLSIMNDLFRLKQYQALNLINLLSFFGHHIPVGLLQFGKNASSPKTVEILTSPGPLEKADLDTTLGTLIHYGLIERTTDAQSFTQTSASHSADESHMEVKTVPDLSESFTGSSQEGFFSIYNGNSGDDVVKIHSVVQEFCRNELRIRDDENKDIVSMHDAGFYDSWLVVAIHFLCTSFDAAVERMTSHSCGIVRDYREYETHASRLVELFPKKTNGSYAPVLREARKVLQKLTRDLSAEIDRMSPSSSQEYSQHQRSVFDRSSSSSSSHPDSSADEGISRQSTWPWTDEDSRTDSPEEMTAPPRFQLEPFVPHIFRQSGYDSEEGYETDGEALTAPRISPALSQMSQTTEVPRRSPAASPPAPPDEQGWQTVERPSRLRSSRERKFRRRARGLHRIRGTKPVIPLVEISPVEGRGSSSRLSADERMNSTMLASAAERALTAVRQVSNGKANGHDVGENRKPTPPSLETATPNKENVLSYASVASRRIQETELPPRRPASIPSARAADPIGLQMKPSVESLDSQSTHFFASPLAHELAPQDLIAEPLMRSTYSDPGRNDFLSQPLAELNLRTAPESNVQSRRGSMVAIDPIRDMSASTPSIFPYAPPLPYDQDITITRPLHPRWAQPAPTTAPGPPGPGFAPPIPRSRVVPVAHPSAVMPGALPLSMPTDAPITQAMQESETPGPEALSRGSSGFSHQSWATEPVRYPPRFSPLPTFHQPEYQPVSEFPRSATPMIPSQAHAHSLAGAGSWSNEVPIMGSALQSDALYPVPVAPRSRVGSVDERLQASDPGWNPEIEPAQLLHFGGHRVDVRDARQRLNESTRLQIPRHVPAYQLYHPNLSGPLIQEHGLVYAPAPELEVYGTRARSGSSPPRPNFDGLGVRFP